MTEIKYCRTPLENDIIYDSKYNLISVCKEPNLLKKSI